MARLVGLKAGDIVRTPSHRQWFFVHKVDGDTIISSGIDTLDGGISPKDRCWGFDELVPESERHIFYDEIAKRNYKFNKTLVLKSIKFYGKENM